MVPEPSHLGNKVLFQGHHGSAHGCGGTSVGLGPPSAGVLSSTLSL